MKKLLIFAVVATMFAACSKDATKDLATTKLIDKFYATIADNDSRVQLNDVCKTVWTSGDRVSVFNKTTGNRRYKFTGNTGDTVGELSYMNGGTTGDAIDKVVAIYPYNASNSVSTAGTITTFVPATQTYCKDSFGVGSSIMVAHSDTEELSFQNVMGWIRIALTGDKAVKRLVLYGCNDEVLAGNATIANDLSIKLSSDATKLITLDCGEGVQLSAEPTYFYIAVVPQTFSKGIYITIVDTDDNITGLSTAKSITVNRNHIMRMKSSECKPITAIQTHQIWYTSYDGKIITPKSYFGAITSNNYVDGKGVITFDCVQKTIGNSAFSGCTNLTGITISDSVISIDRHAFSGCTELASITIGDSVTLIDEYAFNGCAGLTSITIPDSVSEIGNYAFFGCTSITSVTIPDSVNEIGESAFEGCTDMTSVTIPYSITSISKSAFKDCTGLTSVTIPDSITKIGESAFYDCTSLTSLTIGKGVTEIGKSAFYKCRGLKSIYCKPATPPTWSTTSVFYNMESDARIYVPLASLEAYKSAYGWRNYGSCIYGYEF